MKLTLSDWRNADKTEESLSASEQWPSITWQGQQIHFKEPVQLCFTVTGQEKSLFLRGEIAADLELACSRCAEKFLLPMRFPLDEVISLNDDEQEENWEAPFIDRERDELDLSELSLLVLLENLPLRPLCKQECRGLCPTCGQDFNKGDCDCESDDIDPRLAILSQLLKQDDSKK